jgi:hypothetical protein
MFIKLTNGIPETYTIGQLRRDNPNTSIPKDMPAYTLQEFDLYKVKQTSAPQIDSKTHRHTQSVELVNNEWTQVWQVVELPLEQASANIRAHRSYLISQTDWVVTKAYEQQTSVPQSLANYRQLLRDVPQQLGFPYAVVWPEVQ